MRRKGLPSQTWLEAYTEEQERQSPGAATTELLKKVRRHLISTQKTGRTKEVLTSVGYPRSGVEKVALHLI